MLYRRETAVNQPKPILETVMDRRPKRQKFVSPPCRLIGAILDVQVDKTSSWWNRDDLMIASAIKQSRRMRCWS
jgi:hypothetical protein